MKKNFKCFSYFFKTKITSDAFTTDYLHLQWSGHDPVVIDSKIGSLNSGKPRLDQYIEIRTCNNKFHIITFHKCKF